MSETTVYRDRPARGILLSATGAGFLLVGVAMVSGGAGVAGVAVAVFGATILVVGVRAWRNPLTLRIESDRVVASQIKGADLEVPFDHVRAFVTVPPPAPSSRRRPQVRCHRTVRPPVATSPPVAGGGVPGSRPIDISGEIMTGGSSGDGVGPSPESSGRRRRQPGAPWRGARGWYGAVVIGGVLACAVVLGVVAGRAVLGSGALGALLASLLLTPVLLRDRTTPPGPTSVDPLAGAWRPAPGPSGSRPAEAVATVASAPEAVVARGGPAAAEPTWRCDCGAAMVVRRPGEDGTRLLGCAALPACGRTRPMPDR